MVREWIFAPQVGGAYRDGSRIKISPEDMRVLHTAAEIFYNSDGQCRPRVCVPAGWDPNLHVLVGFVLFRKYLMIQLGVPEMNIYSEPPAPNAAGVPAEISKLIDFMRADELDYDVHEHIVHIADIRRRVKETQERVQCELLRRGMSERVHVKRHAA